MDSSNSNKKIENSYSNTDECITSSPDPNLRRSGLSSPQRLGPSWSKDGGSFAPPRRVSDEADPSASGAAGVTPLSPKGLVHGLNGVGGPGSVDSPFRGTDSFGNERKVRKPVIRFGKEDLLHMWRPTRMADGMEQHDTMVTQHCQRPTSLSNFTHDDFMRVWSANARSRSGTGRGRGRGVSERRESTTGSDDGSLGSRGGTGRAELSNTAPWDRYNRYSAPDRNSKWERGHSVPQAPGNPWDGSNGKEETDPAAPTKHADPLLDLDNMAEMALKFREEMSHIRQNKATSDSQEEYVPGSEAQAPETEHQNHSPRPPQNPTPHSSPEKQKYHALDPSHDHPEAKSEEGSVTQDATLGQEEKAQPAENETEPIMFGDMDASAGLPSATSEPQLSFGFFGDAVNHGLPEDKIPKSGSILQMLGLMDPTQESREESPHAAESKEMFGVGALRSADETVATETLNGAELKAPMPPEETQNEGGTHGWDSGTGSLSSAFSTPITESSPLLQPKPVPANIPSSPLQQRSAPPGLEPQSTPLEGLETLNWQYRDPAGTIQGPFTNADMRQWFEEGYFKPELPLKPDCAPPDIDFTPLGDLFPEQNEAFATMPILEVPPPPQQRVDSQKQLQEVWERQQAEKEHQEQLRQEELRQAALLRERQLEEQHRQQQLQEQLHQEELRQAALLRERQLEEQRKRHQQQAQLRQVQTAAAAAAAEEERRRQLHAAQVAQEEARQREMEQVLFRQQQQAVYEAQRQAAAAAAQVAPWAAQTQQSTIKGDKTLKEIQEEERCQQALRAQQEAAAAAARAEEERLARQESERAEQLARQEAQARAAALAAQQAQAQAAVEQRKKQSLAEIQVEEEKARQQRRHQEEDQKLQNISVTPVPAPPSLGGWGDSSKSPTQTEASTKSGGGKSLKEIQKEESAASAPSDKKDKKKKEKEGTSPVASGGVKRLSQRERRAIAKAEEAARKEEEELLRQQQQAAAWGSASSSNQPSLLEIQQEEEKQRKSAQKAAGNQLKNMLGLPMAQAGTAQPSAAEQRVEAERQRQAAIEEAYAQPAKSQKKKGAPKPSSVWETAPKRSVTASASKPKKKSLLEIQQEEVELAKAKRKQQSQSGGSKGMAGGSGAPSTGWASRVGGGNSSPHPPMVSATLSPQQSPAAPQPAPVSSQYLQATQAQLQASTGPWMQVSSGRKTTQKKSAAAGAPAATQRTAEEDDFWGQTSNATASSKSRKKKNKNPEGFGGAALSPEMESWCRQQLMKLAGNDDMTLIHFCMSLTDHAEIRQYLAAYLGSTPQVSAFATDFIQKKKQTKGGGGTLNSVAEDQSGFQQAGGKKSKKKGRPKGQKLDPSILGYSVQSSRIMQGEIDYGEL